MRADITLRRGTWMIRAFVQQATGTCISTMIGQRRIVSAATLALGRPAVIRRAATKSVEVLQNQHLALLRYQVKRALASMPTLIDSPSGSAPCGLLSKALPSDKRWLLPTGPSSSVCMYELA